MLRSGRSPRLEAWANAAILRDAMLFIAPQDEDRGVYSAASLARARSFSVSLFSCPQAARMSRPRGVRTGLA